MSYDVSALTDYVKENDKDIITQTFHGLTSMDYLTVQPNIKTSENIATFVTDAVLQAGACGWSPNGSTVLGKRTLTVADIMVQEALCSKDLEAKMFQISFKAGTMAGAEDMPIEALYIQEKN